jgi:hypothetical protein
MLDTLYARARASFSSAGAEYQNSSRVVLSFREQQLIGVHVSSLAILATISAPWRCDDECR